MFGFYVYAYLMWLFFSINGVIEIFGGLWVCFFIYLKVIIKQSAPEVSIIHFFYERGNWQFLSWALWPKPWKYNMRQLPVLS